MDREANSRYKEKELSLPGMKQAFQGAGVPAFFLVPCPCGWVLLGSGRNQPKRCVVSAGSGLL